MEIQCSELQLDKLQFSTSTQMSLHSHRKECKSACFTSDGMAILTVSADSAKLWNRYNYDYGHLFILVGYFNANSFVRLMYTCLKYWVGLAKSASLHVRPIKEFVVCLLLVTGNSLWEQKLGSWKYTTLHQVSFLKKPIVKHFSYENFQTGKCIERTECHSESIKSLAMYPDQRGFVTCSSDKTVKFWEFDLILDEEFSSKYEFARVFFYFCRNTLHVTCKKLRNSYLGGCATNVTNLHFTALNV